MPDRLAKPRKEGITMVMDKGLTLEEAKNFIENAVPHVDIVKLGFGTAYVTPKLRVISSTNIFHSVRIIIFPTWK